MRVPDELAPSKRAALDALLAEVPLADERPTKATRYKGRQGRRCYVCKRTTTGPMTGHHVVPGDDSTVVDVHARCHRRLHRAGRT